MSFFSNVDITVTVVIDEEKKMQVIAVTKGDEKVTQVSNLCQG